MATASKVKLSTADCGEYHVAGITAESAAKASELLQENHDRFHIFYHKSGFHNHIAHHILTLYALGASPTQIQRQYDNNKSYQRPPQPVDDAVLEDLRDPVKFRKYLANERYYLDYLVFFQGEIKKKGYEEVLNEYVLKGDQRADDMLVRMYAGFLHPIIHLGFGVEFKQPAIIAEALAMAAMHDAWLAPYFHGAEKAAGTIDRPGMKSIVTLLDEIRADKKLSTAADWGDGNKIRDGILKRAPDEMIKYASQFTVEPAKLTEKTAEMTNAAIYFTGAAQHPPKQIKFDFYYMHCVNCSIFFSSFLKQPWISEHNKVRLLEWKVRLDLCMYASRRSPKPLLEEITDYKPKQQSSLDEIIKRVIEHDDDGHSAKLVRAIAHGGEVSKPYGDGENFRIQNGMWLQLEHMAIDSVEDTGEAWVRSAGFEEAWENYEDRPRAQL